MDLVDDEHVYILIFLGILQQKKNKRKNPVYI